ncbi:MAG: DMT family transporter [Candidatus Gracilibacteria bacterium]
MSQWIIFSLFAPFLWAVANLQDRWLCAKAVKNEYILTFIAAGLRLPVFIVWFAIAGWYLPSVTHLLMVLVAGILAIIPVIFYLRALKEEESSRVMLVYYSASPVITFILSTIFLGERFSSSNLTGAAFLLVAAIFSVIKFQKGFLQFRSAVLWVFISSILWPISDIIIKYLTPYFPSTLTLTAWMNVGEFCAIFSVFLFPQFARNFSLKSFKFSKKIWLVLIANMFVFQTGLYLFLRAIALERVALIIVITAIQPLMLFIMELLVHKFLPQVGKVDVSVRSLLPKIVAICFFAVGVWFISI